VTETCAFTLQTDQIYIFPCQMIEDQMMEIWGWTLLTWAWTRQFLVSLTSTMEVNETRNCLIFFLISENWLDGVENGKTQLFNSGGVVKW